MIRIFTVLVQHIVMCTAKWKMVVTLNVVLTERRSAVMAGVTNQATVKYVRCMIYDN